MKIINLDLDDEFINKLFALTSSSVPEMITLVSLKEQLINIKETMRKIKKDADYKANTADDPVEEESREHVSLSGTNQVLVVDNLGVVTYQVQKILSKLGFSITTAKDVYNALSQIEDKEFDIILMDLFIPTEREGFILLEEIRKHLLKKELHTVVGVMSVAGKKEYKAIATEGGADFYVEKSYNWQKTLTDIISDYVGAET